MHGCCMAPVLFNLYTCLAMERWLSKIAKNQDVGIVAHYKYKQRYFKKCKCTVGNLGIELIVTSAMTSFFSVIYHVAIIMT